MQKASVCVCVRERERVCVCAHNLCNHRPSHPVEDWWQAWGSRGHATEGIVLLKRLSVPRCAAMMRFHFVIVYD